MCEVERPAVRRQQPESGSADSGLRLCGEAFNRAPTGFTRDDKFFNGSAL
jgi:hypothetical protein